MQHLPVRDIGSDARLLLVVDQPVLAEYIKLALNHGLYHSRIAPDAEVMQSMLTSWRPHAAIIDMDIIPGTMLAQFAATAPDTERVPVIALTRQGDLKTKLAAFDAGVDDIMTVPFSPEELIARLLVIMRRTYGATVVFTPVLRLGELEIDILNRRVVASGSDVHLTAIEQNLLYLLAANAGQLLTRDDILDHLWGTDYMAESNVVDRHIRNLRIKLQNGWRKPRYIATVPGRGYRFIPTTAEDTAVS